MIFYMIEEEKYTCSRCNKTFDSMKLLNIHMARYEYPKMSNQEVAEYESRVKYDNEIPAHVLANYYDRHGSIKTVPHLKQFVSYVKMVQCVRPFDVTRDFINFYTKVLPWKLKHAKICNSKELANLVFDNQEECDLLYKKYMLEKNPYYGVHDSNRSPFSMNYKGYEGMTDDEKRAHIAKITKRGADDRTSTQIGYWIKRGFSEEEAKIKISERQKTFTLEKCIEKYGEDEGRKRWQERQDKWHKNYKKCNFSKVSQELFWKIYDVIDGFFDEVYFATLFNGKKIEDGSNHEYTLKVDGVVIKPDFFIPVKKAIIEFDGEYWHSRNTNKQRDAERDKHIIAGGYRVYHVKEEDYIKNPDLVVEQCIKFLKS